jgi:hypothetical protein
MLLIPLSYTLLLLTIVFHLSLPLHMSLHLYLHLHLSLHLHMSLLLHVSLPHVILLLAVQHPKKLLLSLSRGRCALQVKT